MTGCANSPTETRQKRTGQATAVRDERAAIGAGLAAPGSRRPSGRCGVRSAVVCYRSTEIPTGEVAVQSYPRATSALGPVERLAVRADDHRVDLLMRDAQFGPRVSLVAGVEQSRLRARDHAGRTSCRARVTRPASGTRVASSNRSVEPRYTPSSVPSKGHIWTYCPQVGYAVESVGFGSTHGAVHVTGSGVPARPRSPGSVREVAGVERGRRPAVERRYRSGLDSRKRVVSRGRAGVPTVHRGTTEPRRRG